MTGPGVGSSVSPDKCYDSTLKILSLIFFLQFTNCGPHHAGGNWERNSPQEHEQRGQSRPKPEIKIFYLLLARTPPSSYGFLRYEVLELEV
jgi:hypothetical protein